MNKSDDADIRLSKTTLKGGDRVNKTPDIQLTPDTIKFIRETLAEGIARKIALAIIETTNQVDTYDN